MAEKHLLAIQYHILIALTKFPVSSSEEIVLLNCTEISKSNITSDKNKNIYYVFVIQLLK